MKGTLGLLFLQFWIVFGACDDLPSLYEYYTGDGINSGLSVDQPYFTLNGKNISLYSGAMHYFRIPPQYWRDRLRKLRAAGLNTVETYVAWNIHETKSGVFDFGTGETNPESFTDLHAFLKIAQEEDLFVIIRPGPFICAEWDWGGYPSWLLREEGITVRTSDAVYVEYVRRYFKELLPMLADYQFTKGGPIIMVQVENEFGYSFRIDLPYLQQLYDMNVEFGIVELLVTCDAASSRSAGSLPELFQTVNFGSDPEASFSILKEIQPNKPLMTMEFYPGWLDHWGDGHHTQSNDTFRSIYESILAYPASVNIYMFHGGTNWGFMNGANNGPGDNSGFQPDTTSYDYDAPLSEAGDYTGKYYIIRELMQQYNTAPVRLPEMPELVQRQEYPSVPINGYLSFNEMISRTENMYQGSAVTMEQLPINDDNGQSYGYIIYRVNEIDIPVNSVLTIKGHLRDTVMVLIDGVLVSNPLSSTDDFNHFGYWRLKDSNITLTDTDLTNVTLDLVVENWGRVNYGNLYGEFKGLTPDNRVYLNDQELTTWIMYPWEFQESWNSALSGWNNVDGGLPKGPGLYRTTLSVVEGYTDTFLDMREWNKGIVIVNGLVLGRYAFIGPQQTLYLPAPFLKEGDNEIIIFEHFNPATEIKFSKDIIFGNR